MTLIAIESLCRCADELSPGAKAKQGAAGSGAQAHGLNLSLTRLTQRGKDACLSACLTPRLGTQQPAVAARATRALAHAAHAARPVQNAASSSHQSTPFTLKCVPIPQRPTKNQQAQGPERGATAPPASPAPWCSQSAPHWAGRCPQSDPCSRGVRMRMQISNWVKSLRAASEDTPCPQPQRRSPRIPLGPRAHRETSGARPCPVCRSKTRRIASSTSQSTNQVSSKRPPSPCSWHHGSSSGVGRGMRRDARRVCRE